MAEDVSRPLRRQVRERAGHRCEYCLMPEWALLAGCEVDHVLSRKHGGETTLSNLALSCARCNRAKGSDVGSVTPATGEFVRLFHPRQDRWNEHFELSGARLVALTGIAEATIRLLKLNEEERLLERKMLQGLGAYPAGKGT